MAIPIVIIHDGPDDYLNFSLRQAIASNPDSDVFLIGSQPLDIAGVTFLDLFSYFEEAIKFEQKNYFHMSSATYQFELICFQRWFVLKAFMEQHELKEVFVCDSDVLVYSNLSDVMQADYPDSDLCLAMKLDQLEYQFAYAAHVSYWTQDSIRLFCDFLGKFYTSHFEQIRYKWNYHCEHRIPGGICDMVGLYFFVKSLSKNTKVSNFLSVTNGACFDDNMNTSANDLDDSYELKEYFLENTIKKITWKHSKPHGHHLKLNRDILFHALHFQGDSKTMMLDFYTGEEFDSMKTIRKKQYREKMSKKIKRRFKGKILQ